MPQMMPMFWTLMLLSVIATLIFIASMIYYSSPPFLTQSLSSHISPPSTWTWKW